MVVADLPPSEGPNVDAALSISPTLAIQMAEPRKATIGGRKTTTAKKGVQYSSYLLWTCHFIQPVFGTDFWRNWPYLVFILICFIFTEKLQISCEKIAYLFYVESSLPFMDTSRNIPTRQVSPHWHAGVERFIQRRSDVAEICLDKFNCFIT